MKYIFTVLLLFIVLSCREVITETQQKSSPTVLPLGKIYLNSSPKGAAIYFDNITVGKITPDSITKIPQGDHIVKLKLSAYKDTTFSIYVGSGNYNFYYVALKKQNNWN